MKTENYNVLGVMSGTSLDGVDLAYISFTHTKGKWLFSIQDAVTIPYSDEWVNRLKHAIDYKAEELELLDIQYTYLLAKIIKEFIDNRGIKDVDFISSHGHTVLHQPDKGVTLQIGNRPEIAGLTGKKVICDFRVQDVVLGGQGAPLVPIGDRMLFQQYTFCLNLGGFSNISFEQNGNRVAFDICPVNTVLNFYAQKLGMQYDAGGEIACRGKILDDLLKELQELDFYAMHYPKSLGFEFVKATVLPLIEKYDSCIEDKLRTFCEHIALQIAKVINNSGEQGDLLITGGGAYNTFLIGIIKAALNGTTVIIPNDNVVQFKEALVFGLLGVLRLKGEVNVLSSVTGANKNHSSGQVFEP